MLKKLRPVVIVLVLLTIITGIVYPMLVTVISQVTMSDKAIASLLIKDGKPAGYELIGLSFPDPRYFWGRPTATGPMANNASASSGSNLEPPSPALMDVMRSRVLALRAADPGNTQELPVDLVTVSGSGPDPHISLTAAEYQLARVARMRNLSADVVHKLVLKHTEGRQLGMLVEPRVNVLELNLAMDAVFL